MKKLVLKIGVKVLIFTIILTILSTFTNSPVINNQLALGQMENDDALYIVWEQYNALRPIITALFGAMSCVFGYSIGQDIYKYTKNKNKENENEKV